MTRTIGAAIGALLFVLFLATVATHLSRDGSARQQTSVAQR